MGATLAALGVGASLLHFVKSPAPEDVSGCVVAVDAQGSAALMKSTYRQWIPAQAQACAGDTRGDLSIALIAGETRTSTVTPVSAAFGKLHYTGSPKDDAKLVKDEIDRTVQDADTAILTAPKQNGGTDILGIICVAHDLLKGHTPSTLIINSDGVNNRDPYRIGHAALDEASVTKYVDELKNNDQLCDLTGTQVHMYGVGIGSGTGKMSGEQLAGVKRFWEAVFRATGADLTTYQRNP